MSHLEHIIPWTDWFPFSDNQALVIAGPCSAESEEQVLATAHELAKIEQVKVYRSGIWKPRTRPGHFEGIGEKGLPWLKKVKAETGLLTAVEVAYPEHIEKCLSAGIDILWIGARTTANPFSVQELADTLKGVDIPVLVKNPVNPDLSLWIGALERMNKAGIKKLAAVHRGFFPFETTAFRNIPKWEYVIELKRQFPHLNIFTDPSHIAGNRDLIQSLSQKAIDLNMDGLMIESHISPDKAKSDAKQQITPGRLAEIVGSLSYRNSNCISQQVQDVLDQYRDQIDSIDQQMLELLAQRMEIVGNIGKYKCENDITILQLRRWESIINSRKQLGKSLGMDEGFIHRLLELIHKESIQRQSQVMENLGKCKGGEKK